MRLPKEKVIKEGESYINCNSSINKKKWSNPREKIEFVEKCMYIEYNEAVNEVQSWKFWKSEPVNDLSKIKSEIADIFIFMMDILKPEIIINRLDTIDEPSFNFRSLNSIKPSPYKTLDLMISNISNTIYNELIKNGDIDMSYGEFMKDVIDSIYFKIRFNKFREDHLNNEIK